MNFKREWYVGFDKEYGHLCRISESVGRQELERFKWKNPDLLCIDKQYGIIIVELDGAIHDRKVQKTIQRNELFRGAGIKLIVLNIADIKECGKTIIGNLESEMLKLDNIEAYVFETRMRLITEGKLKERHIMDYYKHLINAKNNL